MKIIGTETLYRALYDYQQAESLDSDPLMRFFETPLGLNGRTHLDTNMFLSGMLPARTLFQVEQIEVAFLTDSQIEYEALGMGGSFEFRVADKVYVQHAPLGALMRPWSEFRHWGEPVHLVQSVPWNHGPLPLKNRGAPLFLTDQAVFRAEVRLVPEGYRLPQGRVGVVLHGLFTRPVA